MDLLIAALKRGSCASSTSRRCGAAPASPCPACSSSEIFDHNQDEFTKAEPRTIPTIAVVEEAQSVLGNMGSSGEGPYIVMGKRGSQVRPRRRA